MIVIFAGMFFAFAFLIYGMPEGFSFNKSLHLAGAVDKLNILDFKFDLSNRYNIWSGILGGTFLSLSYFGTDQSQVQRYLSGKSLAQSRLGLLFNALVKIPMQFFILLIGVLVFVFFMFNDHPLHFNKSNVNAIVASDLGDDYELLEREHRVLLNEKQETALKLTEMDPSSAAWEITADRLNVLTAESDELREDAKILMEAFDSELDTDDSDYVFIHYILAYLPIGLIGLLLAVIFSAAMSSTSSELSALATTTSVDIYKRSINKSGSDLHYLKTSKLFTILWGILALIFAMTASLFDNLIEAVNIIGSIFYGTILGIFVVAFFIKYIKSRAVFVAAIITEIIIITLYLLDRKQVIELEYLWLNFIGCALVVIIGSLIQLILPGKND
jgi:Na+/proline symporter